MPLSAPGSPMAVKHVDDILTAHCLHFALIWKGHSSCKCMGRTDTDCHTASCRMSLG